MRKSLAAALLLALGWLSPTWAAVQFDQSAISAVSGTAVTTFTPAGFINVGAGANGTSNRALLVGLHLVNGTPGTSTAPSCTWNSVSMGSALGHVGSGAAGDVYMFAMVAPATGQNTLTCSWTTNNQAVITALSVVGADQTGGTTTFHDYTTNTGTGTPATVTATDAAGEIAFATHGTGSSFIAASGTDIGKNNNGNLASAAANFDTAVNATLTYSAGTGQPFASAAVGIKATGGAVAPTRELMLMGVGP
jgi:hypothetical protein